MNEDGWPDLVLAQNNGPVSGFINTGNSSNQIVSVQLLGRKGNPGSVGARIEATGSDRSSQTAEIYGGGGYLSQSSPVLHFGFRAGQKCAKLIIRWPDGSLSTHNTENAGTRLTIRQLD